MPLTIPPSPSVRYLYRGRRPNTASVDNDVDEITVAPTVNESNATVEYLDSTDAAITDANSGKTGQQVSLDVGANTIKVKVTAQDATTDTYTVVVTRALAGQVFVDNTGEVTFANNIQTHNSNSQSFATGPNTGGYILTSISVVAQLFSSGPFSLEVRTTDTDGAPVAHHASMIAPGNFPAGESTITFTAPPNTMLDGDTTYTIILGQVGSTPRAYQDHHVQRRQRGYQRLEHRRLLSLHHRWFLEPQYQRPFGENRHQGRHRRRRHQPRRDGGAGDFRHGAGRTGADRDDRQHRGPGRIAVHVHLPVGAGGRRRRVEPPGHLRRRVRDLHPDRRRRRQEGEGEGELHRQPERQGRTHQRGLPGGRRGRHRGRGHGAARNGAGRLGSEAG